MTTEAVPGSPPEGTAAPESVEVPAGESPATPETTETDADRNWRQVREQIGKLQESEAKLQKERDAAAFERERLARELETLRTQRPQTTDEPEGKTLEDFGYDGEKYAAYLRKQAEQNASRAARQAAEQERSARNWSQFQERATAYAKDNPGYTDAFSRLQGFFPPSIADGLVASEEGPALVEYLGNNVNEAISLRNADPFTAGVLIGQLQSRIKSEREKAAAAKKEPPPPPAPKLDGGTGSGASVKPDSPDSDSLSDAEWARRRNAQEAARRRR